MLALICTVSMFQGLPEQERQQLTEQLALKEKEKVSTHMCIFFLACSCLSQSCIALACFTCTCIPCIPCIPLRAYTEEVCLLLLDIGYMYIAHTLG